jgi:hypothetical protein
MSENWWDQADMSSLSGEARQLYEEIIAEVQRRLAQPESRALRNKYLELRMANPHPGFTHEEMALMAATGAQLFANLNAVIEAVAVLLTVTRGRTKPDSPGPARGRNAGRPFASLRPATAQASRPRGVKGGSPPLRGSGQRPEVLTFHVSLEHTAFFPPGFFETERWCGAGSRSPSPNSTRQV